LALVYCLEDVSTVFSTALVTTHILLGLKELGVVGCVRFNSASEHSSALVGFGERTAIDFRSSFVDSVDRSDQALLSEGGDLLGRCFAGSFIDIATAGAEILYDFDVLEFHGLVDLEFF